MSLTLMTPLWMSSHSFLFSYSFCRLTISASVNGVPSRNRSRTSSSGMPTYEGTWRAMRAKPYGTVVARQLASDAWLFVRTKFPNGTFIAGFSNS
jgi:hypothetical protein